MPMGLHGIILRGFESRRVLPGTRSSAVEQMKCLKPPCRSRLLTNQQDFYREIQKKKRDRMLMGLHPHLVVGSTPAAFFQERVAQR